MPKVDTILVTGARGQLGLSLQVVAKNYPQYKIVFTDRSELDLSQTKSITDYFQQHKFDVIINCAAYTAVDKAESEPALADSINHLAVKELAVIAKQQNAKLIQISTDYVFNGEHCKPYIEKDPVEPQGVYGVTKLASEQAVLKGMENNALVIRTSWVYSEFGHNFVKTMLKLGAERSALSVVSDQVGTPTYAADLAEAIMHIVHSEKFQTAVFPTELYHYSNEGVCSWYDFAKAIFDMSGIACDVSPISTEESPTPAKRPYYSVLNKSKIKQAFAVKVPYWSDSLARCLQALQENKH
jgi:dTDP-4-dehydrorhamnose reductase